MSELARQLFTDRTTLTRNLKPLADAGLVKVADGADARLGALHGLIEELLHAF